MRPRQSKVYQLLTSVSSSLIIASMLVGVVSTPHHDAFAKKRSAEDKVITVRYSYEKQTVDQSSYVLIPIVTRVSKKAYKDFKERHRVLFKAMKADKSANYGATKFATEKDVVFIFLDAKKSRNHRFIMAEAIYTFTANGARAVRFPGSQYDGRDFTRADVDFSAYRLILPYWRGLPPHKESDALFSVSGGVILNMSSLHQRLESRDKSLIADLNKSLKSGQADTVKAIIAANQVKRIKGIEEGLFSLLQSANTELRLAGLEGLKGRTSKEVYRALRQVMDEDPEDQVKDAAAELLAQAKDAKISVAATFHTLRSKKLETSIAAARKLGDMKKSGEIDSELIKMLSHPESSMRDAVIEALIKRKSSKLLVAQLKASSTLKLEWKVEIARALIKDKKTSDDAISFLVTQPNGQAASEAIKSLKGSKIKGKVASWLEKGLRHPDGSARVQTATILADSKDKSALKILSKADLSDAASGEAVHEAMRKVYAAQSDKLVLGDAARQSNVSLKSAATGVLGKLYKKARNKRNQKRAFKAIGQLAQSPKELVRAESARSMGDVGSPEAMALLLKLKDDSSTVVKRAVARAAVAFPEAEMRPTLSAYLKESDARLLEYTLKSLTALKSSDSLNAVAQDSFTQHSDVLTRRAAMRAVATLLGLVEMEQRAKVAGKLYTQLNTEKDAQTKVLIAQALSHVPSDESRELLAAQLQDKNLDLVRALVDALIAHQLPASVSLLDGAMDHSDPQARAYAYEEASKLKAEGLKRVVKKLFTRRIQLESDAKLKAQLEAYFK